MAGLDYDNDGDLDVFVASLAGVGEKVYRNDGPGTFVNQNVVIQTQNDSTLDFGFADLDNDGDIDMVTGQGESGNWTNKIYKNSGPADTVPPTVRAIETPTYGASSTVFHANIQDAIQDDGGDSFVVTSFQSWQGSTSGVTATSGNAFHQGGGTWRAEVPTQAGATGAHLCWTFTDRNGNATSASATAGTVADWTDLGNGLAGGSGVPALNATGALTTGNNITITLTGAAPNSFGAILANFTTGYLPLFGGVLVPAVTGPATFIPYSTDANGDITPINVTWPSAPDCTAVYLQAGTVDGTAPAGYSFSNALGGLQK